MATKTNTTKANATTGKAAPAPASAAPAQGPKVGGVQLPAPIGPLYQCNTNHPQWGKVRPGTHRAYAQAVFATLGKAMPNGFALNQARQALAGNVLPNGHAQASVPAPNSGWAKHNMPTWAAGQQWLVPAK